MYTSKLFYEKYLSHELCADALVGKYLDKDRVGNSSVDDNCLAYAASDSLNTAVYLWYHAARDYTLSLEEGHLADVDLLNQRGRVVLVGRYRVFKPAL